mgnify:FL=1|jgi:hypothetical protein
MAWSGLNLTVEGRKALNQAQLNNRLNFKSIVVGDGNPPSNFSTQKQLVHQLYELTELKIDITENKCVLTADFPNVDYDYYFREIGIIVTTENGDKLYVYDNCGDDAQYIVTTTGTERTEKRLRLILMISDVEHITVSESSILYVAYDEYEKTITELKQNKLDSEGGDISDTIVKFTESQQTENICSGEKLGIIFSKIQKALKDCFVHITSAHVTGVKGSAESIYRTGNVEITAENVGLGNVDDTADSTKSVNYAASAGNAAKVNGHSVNADVPSDAKFTDTKGTCLSGRSSSYGWSVNRLPSDYLIEAFHTAAKDYSMTSPYGNMYWASFEITIPQSNNIKFFDAINITPFATSGLISVSITNYTTSKIQGFVFSPLAETKSISFHVTLHGTAS